MSKNEIRIKKDIKGRGKSTQSNTIHKEIEFTYNINFV